MKKYLIGRVGEVGKLYFVPEADGYNGLYINGPDMSPIPIFSFIARRNDITPIKKTNRQKNFWKLDFANMEWSKRHYVWNENSQKPINPYNKKAAAALEILESISSSSNVNKRQKF